DTLAEGLRRFRGVRPRLELPGAAGGVSVYDDFAHHPTAIGGTLGGGRSAEPGGRRLAVFEPPSATACPPGFQDDFVKALGLADHVVLPPVFRSALPEEQRLSAEQVVADLQRGGVDARYLPSVDEIVRTVARESRSGDLVLVMSNGGFDNIHQKL